MRQKTDKTICDHCGEKWNTDNAYGGRYKLNLWVEEDHMNRDLDFCVENCMCEYLIMRKEEGLDDQTRFKKLIEKEEARQTLQNKV
jgi:hypothetical protein